MQDFHQLRAWKQAHAITLDVYRATRSFPTDELFGLRSQMRRASASIGSNLAEGCGRGSDIDFARFVQVFMGSASELEYQMELSRDLGFLNATVAESTISEVRELKKMLAGLLIKLRADKGMWKAES